MPHQSPARGSVKCFSRDPVEEPVSHPQTKEIRLVTRSDDRTEIKLSWETQGCDPKTHREEVKAGKTLPWRWLFPGSWTSSLIGLHLPVPTAPAHIFTIALLSHCYTQSHLSSQELLTDQSIKLALKNISWMKQSNAAIMPTHMLRPYSPYCLLLVVTAYH